VAEGQSVHLLLTDVIMPCMNGCALADTLLARRPSLRVLFNVGLRGRRSRRLVPGAAFLGKPFQPKTLATKVREILDARPETEME
jgi:CheY-like chemotaxis protein